MWDKTIAIEGRISEYLVMARKHGERWFLAALTDREEREFEINLAFLETADWYAEILCVGLNANEHVKT